MYERRVFRIHSLRTLRRVSRDISLTLPPSFLISRPLGTNTKRPASRSRAPGTLVTRVRVLCHSSPAFLSMESGCPLQAGHPFAPTLAGQDRFHREIYTVGSKRRKYPAAGVFARATVVNPLPNNRISPRQRRDQLPVARPLLGRAPSPTPPGIHAPCVRSFPPGNRSSHEVRPSELLVAVFR